MTGVDIKYELIACQQPIQAKAAGFLPGKRWPVDPCPIFQLVVVRENGERDHRIESLGDIPSLVAHVLLYSEDGTTELSRVIVPDDPFEASSTTSSHSQPSLKADISPTSSHSQFYPHIPSLGSSSRGANNQKSHDPKHPSSASHPRPRIQTLRLGNDASTLSYPLSAPPILTESFSSSMTSAYSPYPPSIPPPAPLTPHPSLYHPYAIPPLFGTSRYAADLSGSFNMSRSFSSVSHNRPLHTHRPTPLHIEQRQQPTPNNPTPTDSPKWNTTLVGSLVSHCYLLTNLEKVKGAYFCFPDVSVRVEGVYRLKVVVSKIPTLHTTKHYNEDTVDILKTMNVEENTSSNDTNDSENNTEKMSSIPPRTHPSINPQHIPIAAIMTNKFRSFSAKMFPGFKETSQLSRTFATQGVKIPIRRPGK